MVAVSVYDDPHDLPDRMWYDPGANHPVPSLAINSDEETRANKRNQGGLQRCTGVVSLVNHTEPRCTNQPTGKDGAQWRRGSQVRVSGTEAVRTYEA